MEDKPHTTEDDDIQLTKPKKPRSEKQLIAFQQAMSKRKENIEKRKEEKLIQASEILVKASVNKVAKSTQPKEVKPPKIIIPRDSESDTEEEVIIVKSKPKAKKKVKKIIIEDSSSDDDNSSIDSDGSKKYNKKSYSKSKRRDQSISIQRQSVLAERPKPVFNSANFFI